LTYSRLEWAGESEKLRRLWIVNKGTLWWWSIIKGGLYFKLSKDTCMLCNPKALHKCLWIFHKKILDEIKQDFDEFELIKKKSLGHDSKEISGQPYNQEAPCSNPVIGKYQFTLPSMRIARPYNQETLSFPTLWSRSICFTLQPRSTHFKPCDKEISIQPCY